ncbi:MAG: GumC family protein [Phyllobacterium sp.]
MAAAGTVGADADVDIGVLFASLWRDRLRIVLVAILLTALAFVIASLMTPRYRAETRILIETRESIFTRPDGERTSDAPILDQEGVRSQVEVINSSDLLKAVAKKLDLASHPEFAPEASQSLLGRMLTTVGLRRDLAELGGDESVLQSMREHLQVYNVDSSRVIVIQFSSRDPELAAKVPNAIADEYVARQSAAKQQSDTEAADWLEPEIADLSQRVKDAEARVAAFRGSSDLLIGQNNSVLATQQLSELSSELSRVRASRAAAEARAASVRQALQAGSSVQTLPDIVASGLMQRLRERQVQLNNDIADLSTSLLEGHPRIKALRAQLADLNRQMRVEARNILESLEKEADMARSSETKLNRDLNALKSQSARAGEDEVQLRALEREAAAQRALLETYLTRYREASSRTSRDYQPADARVFSRADVPVEPYFPKKIPIAAAALAGSLLLMSIVTLLGELFSGRAFRASASVSRQPADEIVMPGAIAPAPVFVPDHTDGTSRRTAYEVGRELDLQEETFELAAEVPAENSPSAVADDLIARGAKRVVMVSPEGDEGSSGAVMLVRALADRGLRVVLLDMTGTGAIGEAMAGSADLSGITDLLASDKQFTDIIHDDLYSDAHVIPAGNANPARAMRAAERLPIILSALQTAYDKVVVECGPSDPDGVKRLLVPEAEVVMNVVDPDNAFVVESKRAFRKADLAGFRLLRPVSPPLPFHSIGAASQSENMPG